jgi:site-specific DNA-methyltransferase (adenine-specific)
MRQPKIQKPDLYHQVGEISIWHGDSRALSRALPPNSVHLVVTSPPYNVGTDYAEHNDRMAEEEYLHMISQVVSECWAVMVEGARICLVVPFGIGRKPYRPFVTEFLDTLEMFQFQLRGIIAWDKGSSGNRTSWGSFRLPTDPHIRDTMEAIIVAHTGEGKLAVPPEALLEDDKGKHTKFLADPKRFMELAQDHWTVAPATEKESGHPAAFPVELAERLIWFYAYPGCTVLDPFAGSGSTGLAAQRNGCRAHLVEIDEGYCALMKSRLATAPNL